MMQAESKQIQQALVFVMNKPIEPKPVELKVTKTV